MAKAKRATRPTTEKVPVPKNLEEVAQYHRQMALVLSSIAEQETEAEQEIQRIAEKAGAHIARHRATILALAKSVREYAEVHRAELTDEERRKTVEIPNAGSFQWYKTPFSVKVEGTVEDIIFRIKALGLNTSNGKNFIRIKEELDKEALLKDPVTARSIEGIDIVRQEKFAIRPPGRDERIECNTDSGRWKVSVATADSLPSEEE